MNRFTRVVIIFLAYLPLTVFAVQAGDRAPAWEAKDLNHDTVAFPVMDQKQTTVLVFWATWCPYCQVFMPHLVNIESDYRDRGVRVLAVNCKEETREQGGDPVAYLREHGYAFQAVLHGDAIAELYDVQFIPGLMIIGTDGTVIYRRKSTDLPAGREVAEFWDSEVRAVLDEYLP